MKKRIYLVLETEADEDDKSILNDIEQELGMATHYFETVSYSENGFPDKWISVKDRKPKHHTPVLAFCDNGDTIFGFMDFYKHWAEAGSEIPYTVTHWMPLPEPPKEV